jgi:hypothetical protein
MRMGTHLHLLAPVTLITFHLLLVTKAKDTDYPPKVSLPTAIAMAGPIPDQQTVIKT